MSDRDEVREAAFLATVPLLEGIPPEDITELARVVRRRDLAAGEILWRDGDPAQGMVWVVDGRISVTFRLPGGRTVEITSVGSREALGEIPLLDGGRHSASATAVEAATILSLSRADFAALVQRQHPTAFTLKRRIAVVACQRLRVQLGTLSASLGGGPPPELPAQAPALEYRRAPSPDYVRRMATFHAFDPLALWGILTAGRYALVPRGRTLIAEGQTSPACYLMINGAVEHSLIRGDHRIRIGLAGPGRAFGYEGLIDGGPAPMTATTRERTLLLELSRNHFERLFHGDSNGSHAFLDVMNRDLMAWLRQVLRPHAQLAVGGASTPAAAAGPTALL